MSMPINKITKVILIGEEYDYYRMYLCSNSKKAIRIDLKKKVFGNFIVEDKEHIEFGDLTRSENPDKAAALLSDTKYLNGKIKPDKQLIEVLIFMLLNRDFGKIKKCKNKETFSSWLFDQIGNDDLVGDLANDLKRKYFFGGIESYEIILSMVKEISLKSRWNINTFSDSKIRGYVNPLLVLEMAKMEFDMVEKKSLLNKFAIRDPYGYVYFLKPERGDLQVKIGRAKDIKARISQLQTSLPHDLITIGYIESDDSNKLERKIQKENSKFKLKREWFQISDEEAIRIIKENNGKLEL